MSARCDSVRVLFVSKLDQSGVAKNLHGRKVGYQEEAEHELSCNDSLAEELATECVGVSDYGIVQRA